MPRTSRKTYTAVIDDGKEKTSTKLWLDDIDECTELMLLELVWLLEDCSACRKFVLRP